MAGDLEPRDCGSEDGGLADWRNDARCRGIGPELFHADDSASSRRAKAFCAGCPVWAACLAAGMEENCGVWGGLNNAERARLRRLRQRLTVAPTDPANSVDVRRLLQAGVPADRLSDLTGLDVQTIVDAAHHSRPRRPVRQTTEMTGTR